MTLCGSRREAHVIGVSHIKSVKETMNGVLSSAMSTCYVPQASKYTTSQSKPEAIIVAGARSSDGIQKSTAGRQKKDNSRKSATLQGPKHGAQLVGSPPYGSPNQHKGLRSKGDLNLCKPHT